MPREINAVKNILKAVKMPKSDRSYWSSYPMYNNVAYHNGRISATNGAALIECYKPYPENLEGRYTDGNGVLNEKERPTVRHIRKREKVVNSLTRPIATLTQEDIKSIKSIANSSKSLVEKDGLRLLYICNRYVNLTIMDNLITTAAKFTKGNFIVKVKTKDEEKSINAPLLFEAEDGAIKFVIMSVLPYLADKQIVVSEYELKAI